MALDILKLKIEADGSQAKRELQSVEQQATKTAKAVEGMGSPVASVAKELGVYNDVTNKVVQSTSKLEQTTKGLSAATADSSAAWVEQQMVLWKQQGQLADVAAASKLASEQQTVLGKSVGFTTAAVQDWAGAITAVTVVGGGLFAFLRAAVEAHDRETGSLDESRQALAHLRGEWEHFLALIGGNLAGPGGQGAASTINSVADAFGFLGPYLAQAISYTLGLQKLGAGIREVADGIQYLDIMMRGVAAPKAPGAPSLFAGSAASPIGSIDATAIERELNAERARLDSASRLRIAAGHNGPFVVPSLSYDIGGLPGGHPFGLPVQLSSYYGAPSLGYNAGIHGPIGAQFGIPQIPNAPSPGFLQQVFGGNFGGNLANTILSAITGGGSMLKGAGSLVGSTFGSVAAKSLSGIGGFLGSALGIALPGVGALLGPALGGLFGKLFGESQGHKDMVAANAQIGDLKAGLLRDFGSAENIKLLGGGDLNAGWGGAGVGGLKAFSGEVDAFRQHATQAMNDMIRNAATAGTQIPASMQPILESMIRQGQLTQANANLLLGLPEAGVPSFKQVEEAAESLGVKVETLGNKVQGIKLGEQADAAAHSFEVLRDAGADMGQVFEQSAPKMQQFVNDALKMGLDLPASIKPWLQQMVDAGLLVDSTGQKLTDLSKFNFTKPLEQSVQDLINKMNDLIEALGTTKDITKDLNGSTINVNVNRHIKDEYEEPPDTNPDQAWTGGVVTPWGIQRFDRGGRVRGGWGYPRGADTVRAWLTPGELVLNAAQQRNLDGALRSGGQTVHVHFHEPVIANDYSSLSRFADFINKATLHGLSTSGIRYQ